VPLYEYRCDACGERFEVIQKFSDPPPAACTKCGKGPVVRLMSSPAIQFKGSGWYITDYAQKGKSGSDTSSGSADGKGGTNSADSAKPDSTSKADSSNKSEAPPASGPSKPSGT
jgi:putative FmdB family regulatory protein